MCEKYLLSYHKETILNILGDQEKSKQFSININFLDLVENDPNLGNKLLQEPEKFFGEWDSATRTAVQVLQSESGYVFKSNIHCRIYSLPKWPELDRTTFPKYEVAGKFLQVSGTVVRITMVKMLESKRHYICTKCKYITSVSSVFELKNIFETPKTCENPENCTGTIIIPTGELQQEFCKDYQEIKMQEIVNKLDVGCMPNSMWITVEDDLVDSCKPGDNITVCGIVKRRWGPFVPGNRVDVELVIKGHHILVNNNTSPLSMKPELKDMFESFWKTYSVSPLAARDIIVKSICPQVFGLHIVKLAMAVVLAGGSYNHDSSNTGVKVRAEPHLLLVGDPGTGKSELLRFASKLISRSVLTTGAGSTAAGITAAAIMENGEWQLEGGALVLSDGGICCIDELNSMKEHDRTSIHEAMEQQTISVAKAGIVCKLSTRCSVLAATNPKGNIDPSQPLAMNIALASPLLSRFDLILLLRDKVDEKWDTLVASYILDSLNNVSSFANNIRWDIETLQAYFALIKKIHPVLTDDANRILCQYYELQRRRNSRNKSRSTVRLLDSLVRLSQGHARLMYHYQVQTVDAVFAVILVESMEPDSSVFGFHFSVQGDFPDDPMKNYQELVQTVLNKLELQDLLEKEMNPGVSSCTSQNKTKSTLVSTQNSRVSDDDAVNINTVTERKHDYTFIKPDDVISDLAALKCMSSINEAFSLGDEEFDDSVETSFNLERNYSTPVRSESELPFRSTEAEQLERIGASVNLERNRTHSGTSGTNETLSFFSAEEQIEKKMSNMRDQPKSNISSNKFQNSCESYSIFENEDLDNLDLDI